MTYEARTKTDKGLKWLLFFYTVPSKPVSSRMKIWRKLVNAGAVQAKGSVYILPHSEDNYEFLQWLTSEVASMNGDGTFIIAGKTETMTNDEIISLFNHQRETDYRNSAKGLDDLQRQVNSIKKGSGSLSINKLSEQFNKYLKKFGEIKKIDFFSSKEGSDMNKRVKAVGTEIKKLTSSTRQPKKIDIIPRDIDDYQKKVWITRKRPFVDRMASAWLINKFIDRNAVFQFIDDQKKRPKLNNAVYFDIRDGDITHAGDMCTAEVIVKSFGLKDRAVKRIAELVHELDLKDEKYSSPDTRGVEEILLGIRKTAKGNLEALEKGMAVFDMLYASKT